MGTFTLLHRCKVCGAKLSPGQILAGQGLDGCERCEGILLRKESNDLSRMREPNDLPSHDGGWSSGSTV
jgi:Zn-finger nucleic acid-binding protein